MAHSSSRSSMSWGRRVSRNIRSAYGSGHGGFSGGDRPDGRSRSDERSLARARTYRVTIAAVGIIIVIAAVIARVWSW
jgi:hypothetical protein